MLEDPSKCLVLSVWNLKDVIKSSLAVALSILVLRRIEAVSDQLELLPVLVVALVVVDSLSVMTLHLTPKAFYAIVLWSISLVEDELDALFFDESLRLLTCVDSTIVYKDIPPLPRPLKSQFH